MIDSGNLPVAIPMEEWFVKSRAHDPRCAGLIRENEHSYKTSTENNSINIIDGGSSGITFE